MGLGMQPACSINNNKIKPLGPGFIAGIMSNACRITTWKPLNYVDPKPFTPNDQLINGCCSECIASCDQYFFSIPTQEASKLSNRCSFTRPVDPSDHNNCWSIGIDFDITPTFDLQKTSKVLTNKQLGFFINFLIKKSLFHAINKACGCGRANISKV